ncbi:Cell division cycle-associated protein 4 [Sciurus carolinensis]|uniref:Cell division cycle-associated protein 4 n=1 Tax=Sciurus carolinensis TaxID=30640 RepID=A0AA41MJW1_SCICA|nr:Cell division cycle-associated protein 4 [Sciurus carolinensis]
MPSGILPMSGSSLRVLPNRITEGARINVAPKLQPTAAVALDLSLGKLQLCHRLVKPSSVIIANTVRQIQEEMSRDGTWKGAAPQSAGRVPLDCLGSTETLCHTARGPEAGHPAPDLGDDLLQSPVSNFPQSAQHRCQGTLREAFVIWATLWKTGSFQKSLVQIFENKSPTPVEELFSDVDSSYYNLDTVMIGMMGATKPGLCDGLEGFATAALPPGSSCKFNLAQLVHVMEILAET